jgi:rhamnose transport system permease protein
MGSISVSHRLASLGRWESFLAALVVLTFLIGSAASSAFATSANLSAAAASYTEIALIALPMTLIIIMGDIDLSVGSVVALASTVFGRLTLGGFPLVLRLLIVLGLGVVAGGVNAVLVVGLRLPSLVVTLGTLTLYAGLARVTLSAGGVADFPPFVGNFGSGYIPGTLLPWAVVIVLVAVVPFAVILHGSRLGRQVFSIGGNAQAALYSGVRTERIRFASFVMSGVVGALAGLMLTARLNTASPDNGATLVLTVLAAVLLGGVSVFGGKGTLAGVLLAIVLLAAVQNILSLRDVNSNAQQVAIGGLLIFSVLATDGYARVRAWLQNRPEAGSRSGRNLGMPTAREAATTDGAS